MGINCNITAAIWLLSRFPKNWIWKTKYKPTKKKKVPYMVMLRDNDQKTNETPYMEMSHENDEKSCVPQ